MIALFAHRKSNRQAVSRRRKWTRGIRRVGAGRIFEAIEIEDQLAGFVEAVAGEAGIEEATGAVGGRGAGGVAENKEQLGHRGIFQDRLEAKGFPRENNSAPPGTG